MKSYLDSSVLLAAIVEEENHHEAAFKIVSQAVDCFTSTHALAEVFATLTSGRLNLQLTPSDAKEVIQGTILASLKHVELSLADYRMAFEESQRVGARGGAIFDMLHLQAARKCKAQKILTLNVRHFQAFAPDLRNCIFLP